MGNNIDENAVSSAAGIAGTVHLFSFSEYIAKGDFTSALKLVSKLHNESCDIDSLCTELTLHFRNLMVAKTVKECDGLIVCSKDELEKIKIRASELKLSKILSCIEILEKAAANIKNAVNKKIQLEAAVIKMCTPAATVGIGEELETRISALEEKINFLSAGRPVDNTPAPEKKKEITETPASPETVTSVEPETSAQTPFETTSEEKPAETSAEQKQIVDDGPFYNWSDVLEALKKYDIPLFGILATSTAVIKNGRVIINSENPTLYDFICADTHSRELARAIYEVLGQKMKIAVSNSEKSKAATSPLEDLKNKINNFNNN
jgi:DNA polymerase-3 subunit gamma/tau